MTCCSKSETDACLSGYEKQTTKGELREQSYTRSLARIPRRVPPNHIVQNANNIAETSREKLYAPQSCCA